MIGGRNIVKSNNPEPPEMIGLFPRAPVFLLIAINIVGWLKTATVFKKKPLVPPPTSLTYTPRFSHAAD